jgi:hypothetical protein
MGLLKEKSSYRPSPVEVALAWVLTGASGLAVAVYLLRTWIGG